MVSFSDGQRGQTTDSTEVNRPRDMPGTKNWGRGVKFYNKPCKTNE
jgi:hypothetical protein